MSHANATLTPYPAAPCPARCRPRLDLCGCGEDVHGVAANGKEVGRSVPPRRHRWDGRPQFPAAAQPDEDLPDLVRLVVGLRWRYRLGPVQIAGRLGMPASTVHAVLVRCRINRLSRIDRVTGEPLRRYEHDHPGSLIHVDVTKFGNIPDGGGHRFVGRQQGEVNKRATPDLPRAPAPRAPNRKGLPTHRDRRPLSVAYAETCSDEKASTAAGVLERAVAWFTDHGVTVERVLSDNGNCYRSFAWRDTCAALGIVHKRTRPYRPQTNGKIERFHHTLGDGWAYARFYNSEAERRAALPDWLHFYNHHEPTPPSAASPQSAD